MMRPTTTLKLATSPVSVVEANGMACVCRGGVSVSVAPHEIPALVAALLVAGDRLGDAADDAGGFR